MADASIGVEIEGNRRRLPWRRRSTNWPERSAPSRRASRHRAQALWPVEAWPAAPVLIARSNSGWRCSRPGLAEGSSRIGEERLDERIGWKKPAGVSAAAHRMVFVHGSDWPAADRRERRPSSPLKSTPQSRSAPASILYIRGFARARPSREPLPFPAAARYRHRHRGAGDCGAKPLDRDVLASDIDCAAARVAAHHVGRNGLRGRVRVICAPGYRARAVQRSRYDLILSNILARPLSLMARDLAAALTPGGVAVLSGLLRRQERMVLAAHRMQGLAMAGRIEIADGRRYPVRRLRSGSGMTRRLRPNSGRYGSVARLRRFAIGQRRSDPAARNAHRRQFRQNHALSYANSKQPPDVQDAGIRVA